MDTGLLKITGLPVSGGKMSNESNFSGVMDVVIPDGPPSAPVIKKVEFTKGIAQVLIGLPLVDADGSELTGLTKCCLFVKEDTFLPTPAEERALGTQTYEFTIPEVLDISQDIVISVPGLRYGKTYHLAATCID